MADFVTVLQRAVENLEDNNEQARRALYEKAKSALMGQLRALDPPPSQEELDRQSAELDTAIEQVEAGFAVPKSDSREDGSGGYDTAASSTDQEIPDPTSESSAQTPHGEPSESNPEAESLADFRAAVAETTGLGAATSAAARTARENYSAFESDTFDTEHTGPVASDSREWEGTDDPYGATTLASDRPDPTDDTHRPAAQVGAAASNSPRARQSDSDEMGFDATRSPEPFPEEYDDVADRGAGLAVWIIVILMIVGIAGVGFWQRDALVEVAASFGGGQEESVPASGEAPMDDRVPTVPDDADGIAEAPDVPSEDPPAAGEDVAGEGVVDPGAATLPDEATRIAQAMLVEEGQGESTNSLEGSVNWSLLDDPEAPEGASKVIRGTVEIPEREMSLTLAIRRNTDPDLPATHTVELLFDMPEDFPGGGIAGVAGLVMKANPQSTGQPLVGAVVPVTDSFYLLGLSESEFDQARNIEEMKRRDFIDVPLAYADESRAILSIAKGESGNEVFAEAFEAWGQ